MRGCLFSGDHQLLVEHIVVGYGTWVVVSIRVGQIDDETHIGYDLQKGFGRQPKILLHFGVDMLQKIKKKKGAEQIYEGITMGGHRLLNLCKMPRGLAINKGRGSVALFN